MALQFFLQTGKLANLLQSPLAYKHTKGKFLLPKIENKFRFKSEILNLLNKRFDSSAHDVDAENIIKALLPLTINQANEKGKVLQKKIQNTTKDIDANTRVIFCQHCNEIVQWWENVDATYELIATIDTPDEKSTIGQILAFTLGAAALIAYKNYNGLSDAPLSDISHYWNDPEYFYQNATKVVGILNGALPAFSSWLSNSYTKDVRISN